MTPRWQAFLDGLPDGVRSYPQCTAKAVLARQFYADFGRPQLPAALPSEVHQLAKDPPPVNVFVSEVHQRALFLAVGDVLGYDDDAFVARVRDSNRKLLGGPVYRLLFKFLSTERLARNLAPRWGMFHRGTEIELLETSDHSALVFLRTPPRLVTALLARIHATSVEVALEAVVGRPARTEVLDVGDEGARFSVRW